MKYLDDLISWKTKRYQSVTDVRNNCEDILLELSDKGFEYKVYGSEANKNTNRPFLDKDLIRISIGDQLRIIKLKDFELEFEHLLSYLKEEGFILEKDSYYENSMWENYECCPMCNSEYVFLKDDCRYTKKCEDCNHIGNNEDFQKPEHPLTIGDLIYSIKNNFHIDNMLLVFIRNSSL